MEAERGVMRKMCFYSGRLNRVRATAAFDSPPGSSHSAVAPRNGTRFPEGGKLVSSLCRVKKRIQGQRERGSFLGADFVQCGDFMTPAAHPRARLTVRQLMKAPPRQSEMFVRVQNNVSGTITCFVEHTWLFFFTVLLVKSIFYRRNILTKYGEDYPLSRVIGYSESDLWGLWYFTHLIKHHM